MPTDWTGDSIRLLREELALTQDQFAKVLEVRRATVADWERGVAKPSRMARGALDRIAKRRKQKSPPPNESGSGLS